MSDTPTPAVERNPSSWLRWLLVLAGCTVLAGAVFGWLLITGMGAGARLRAITTNLDATDPGWRLEDIDRARPNPPPAEDSAAVILFAVSHLPRNWPPASLSGALEKVPPVARLDGERRGLLEREMKGVVAALAFAGRLPDLPAGRCRLDLGDNPLGVVLNDQQETRRVATLLEYDSWLRADGKDTDGALRSARGCINAGRSLGDEPFIISQLIRMANVGVGCQAVERALGLGEGSDAELARVQDLLALEEQHPTLLAALRGERALQHRLWESLRSGRMSVGAGFLSELNLPMSATGLRHRIFGYTRGDIDTYNALGLEILNACVEIARLPPERQAAEARKLEGSLAARTGNAALVRLLTPATRKTGEASRRKLARVRALRALLAAERHRMAHGRWPAKLEEVGANFLSAVPLDPFDGKPLRYRVLNDGVVVYSVGPDEADGGGNLERGTTPGGADVGHRLWNVSARRQVLPLPALPEVPPK